MRTAITVESTNGKILVIENDFDVAVEFGRYRIEYVAETEEVTVLRERGDGWQPVCGTGPARREAAKRTMRPHCTACGEFLLPCSATATGIHSEIVGAGA